MKLYDAIKLNLNDEPNAPCRGKNGYGGEQDGSYTIFSRTYQTSKISNLKEIPIPKGWEINWARKKRCVIEGAYYEFVLYTWSDWERSKKEEENFRREVRKAGVEAI